jgi:Porin PorA
MRGIIGLILAGLGAFLILVAVLLPTWVIGQIMKFPLNEYETATLEAHNASYFSASSLSEKTGVTMEATYTIKGDGSKGNSSTAVWNEYSYVYDLTNHQPVQQMSRTLAFNRRTGQLVDCCGASLNGDTSVRQTGLVGYVFPIGTQKQTYQVFDTTLLKPMPFVYSGTATIQGIQTYMFIENVTPTQTGTIQVPGSMVGSASASVQAPEYDQLHLIYYVDPETGALVDVNEHQTTSLRNPATGATAVVLFDADLLVTPASLNMIIGLDNNGRSELTLLNTTLPIVLGVVGGIALVAGIFLARKRRDGMAELDVESRDMAASAAAEPARGRHSAGLADILPGAGDDTKELAAEEGEGPDIPGPRHAR